MKKLLLLIVFAGIFSIQNQAQQRLGCGSTTNADLQNDPEWARNQAELERHSQPATQATMRQRLSGSRTHYIIPVVFHIIHDYGNENISAEQVHDAIRVMNIDWNKMNADTANVIPSFANNIAMMDVEFRLASIDPNGNCTDGIDRIYSNKTYNADEPSKLNPWPCNKYVNIWVVHSLQNTAAAAYAHVPGGACNVDGIISRYDYVGSIGTSSPLNSRTLTHEMGHVFNLQHPWGPTNQPGVACGNDQVNDTPITMGWDHCPTPSSAAVCNPSIIENYQNFMDYSYCDLMFTNDQKARVDSALVSSVSGRNHLWSAANLTATGTDGSPITICTPIADFQTDYTATCVGDSIHFLDLSWHAPITSWHWSFPGGNPSTSTDSNPAVSYPSAGVYSASLNVSSVSGSDSITRVSIIHVSDSVKKVFPYVEDFEDSTSFPGDGGWIINHDASYAWARVTNASVSPGVASIKMNNFFNIDGESDSWVTPSIDFSNVDFPINIKFSVANAQSNSGSTDALKLYYSTNCGRNWTLSGYSKSGIALSTAGIITTNFIPTSSQWRQETVSMNILKFKPNVRFRFENVSNSGNNTYIDNINMTGNILGIDEATEIETGFTLYPNPTTEITTVGFYLVKTNDVKLEVKDILGKTISTVINERMESGMHEYKTPALSSGIYIIDLTVDNKHHIRKLVVS